MVQQPRLPAMFLLFTTLLSTIICGFGTATTPVAVTDDGKKADDAFSGADFARRLLPDNLVSSYGARCMSGTPGGYYWQPSRGANASKYVIYFEGGGECRTVSECQQWAASHAINSTVWSPTRPAAGFADEMGSDCNINPDFCDWHKIFVPYCTGDMHAGTRVTRQPALGNWYFAGHNTIAALLVDIRSQPSFVEPTHMLVTGSSAGGIAALMHTDFVSAAFSRAVVKGAPQCGFFYAGVTAEPDFTSGVTTPVSHLGFIHEWAPYLPEACAQATNNNMSACTDAHYLYPHLKQPIFVRENQYDTAKLANCGWDRMASDATDYLKNWGAWMRAQLKVVAASGKSGDGFFSASCLEHGGNFGWETSPTIKGVHMRTAMRNWFFDLGNSSLLHNVDDCGDLPCTTVKPGSQQHCPHMGPGPGPGPSPPLSPACERELKQDCPNVAHGGARCCACVRAHAHDLIAAGCPHQAQPVFQDYCGGCSLSISNTTGNTRALRGAGHHVCDLSATRRVALFGR